MTGEIERLFDLALRHEPGERAAVLRRACSDPELTREVESLLAADELAGDFLEPRLAQGSGTHIGPYRLLGKLGEGETSSVYLAERDDEYRQRVAIKLIRPGMDSRQILQRFHQERQILASLNHPNIARMLDGGSTPAGQPYFVMEHVDGEPLDVHCRQAGPPLVPRLELFRLICHAVHYAHCNLVVHRDLKPGNILVGRDGTPKLVDFGIAKLLDPERAGIRVEPTVTVARLMTPHYASPEQFQGRPVSTASDVYSLGVVLYQLLTGRRPYELGSLSLHDVERVVCEATPPPPSHVVHGRRERLPRDLDNIVLMAMRKEPERRYASAQELADDVRRCLQHRPVLARRDTLGYRASSFIRRNTGAVAAAATIFLLAIAGVVATTWQWRKAVSESTRAETERRTAERTRDFVVELFKVPDSPVEVTARELLVRGAAELRDDARQPPGLRAALTHTLGVVHRNLGDYRQAAALLEDAVVTRLLYPGSERDLADSMYQLGAVEADNGKARLGESLLQGALAIRIRLFGPDDLAVADALEELANNVGYYVSWRAAEGYLLRALDIRRHQFSDSDPRLAASVAQLAAVYSRSGHYDGSDALFRQALMLRGYPPDAGHCHPGDHDLFYERGLLRYRQGYFVDAERDVDIAIACLERVVGSGHIKVVDLRSTRIRLWCEQGHYAAAEALARSSLAERLALHGSGSPAVDNGLHHLAHVLAERGKLAEAAEDEAAALAQRESLYGHVHSSVAGSLMVLGDIEVARGDARAAEVAYRDALAVLPPTMGDDHPDIGEALRGLAGALLAQGRIAEARTAADRALALQRRKLRPGHPAIAATLATLGTIAQIESPAAAEPLLRDALAIWQAALGPDHAYVARAESLLGACLALQHRTREALALLRAGERGLRTQLGDDHPETRRAQQRRQAAEASSADAM